MVGRAFAFSLPPLQSTLHNKAIAVNSTTPTVICIVLNKQRGTKSVSGYQKRNKNCPCFLNSTGRLGLKRGRNCYVTSAFSGIPKQWGTKSELAASPLPSRGPKQGGNATPPLHSRGPPNKGGQNHKWLPHPCLLGGPKEGGNAMSPLHSRGSPNNGGQNQNWLPHPCLLGGPKEGRNATSPLHSRGSPTKGTKSDLKTYTRGNNDAPSISKYGSLVRADVVGTSQPSKEWMWWKRAKNG